jgi:hypothetical protein
LLNLDEMMLNSYSGPNQQASKQHMSDIVCLQTKVDFFLESV